MECLEVLDYKEELERARSSYEEQMVRKVKFDAKIESWRSKVMKSEQTGAPLSRKSSRTHAKRSRGSSSVSLAVAKKKEQLALAQLKTKQVLHEQELKRKMSELQYAKEIIEAQMEGERAAISLNVYEEVRGWQDSSSSVHDYKKRLEELVLEDANVGENHEVFDVKTNI